MMDIAPAAARKLAIETPDGTSQAWLFTPSEGTGPWPGVLIYTDIMGVRPLFKAMAQRLADAGFAVLLPNLFHRLGPPLDPPLSVKNSGDFGRLAEHGGNLVARDDRGRFRCVAGCAGGAARSCTGTARLRRLLHERADGGVDSRRPSRSSWHGRASFHGGHLVMGGRTARIACSGTVQGALLFRMRGN